MEIREVSFEVVSPFARAAAKDGVSVKATPTTRWWAAFSKGGVVLGFNGLLVLKDRARPKGGWVKPQERGSGVGLALTEKVIAVGQSLRSQMDVFTYHPQFWAARGFRQTGIRGKAIVMVWDGKTLKDEVI